MEKEQKEIFGRRNVFFCGGEKKEKERRGIFGEERSLSGQGKKMMAKVETSKRLVPNGSDKSHQVLPVARLVLIKPESPLAVQRVLHHHIFQLNL